MRRGPKPARVRDLEKRLAEALQREDETSQRLAEALGQLQARDGELTEAHEQQNATSEILRVISQSQTDVQPVFDAIAERVVKLCDGLFSSVFRYDGHLIHFVAHNNWTREGLDTVRGMYPRAPSRETQVATAILDRKWWRSAITRTTRPYPM